MEEKEVEEGEKHLLIQQPFRLSVCVCWIHQIRKWFQLNENIFRLWHLEWGWCNSLEWAKDDFYCRDTRRWVVGDRQSEGTQQTLWLPNISWLVFAGGVVPIAMASALIRAWLGAALASSSLVPRLICLPNFSALSRPPPR